MGRRQCYCFTSGSIWWVVMGIKMKPNKIKEIVNRGFFVRATGFAPRHLYWGVKSNGEIGWYRFERGSMNFSSTPSPMGIKRLLREHEDNPWTIYKEGDHD